MQTKDYSITLDMLRTLPFRPFEIVEGDTGNILHVTLLNNGDAMDLTNSKLCIVFASSSGFAMQDETSGIEKAEASGTFDVTLLPTAYGAGNVSADIQVYSGDDDATLITSTRFDFRCRKSLVSGDIIRANEAYPPLVEATRIANEATEAALAAIERIDTDIGELNVQANWTEADSTSDSFIKNKPAIPSAPGDVGAASATHASQHASDGSDAITPASIGAAGLNANDRVLANQANAVNVEYTTSRTLSLSDAGEMLRFYSSSAAMTVTIPTNANVAFPIGTEIEIVQWGDGAVTIAKETGVSVRSLDGMVDIAGRYACVALKHIMSDVWLLAGALV